MTAPSTSDSSVIGASFAAIKNGMFENSAKTPGPALPAGPAFLGSAASFRFLKGNANAIWRPPYHLTVMLCAIDGNG